MAVGQPSLARWGVDYDPERLPPELPPYSQWSQPARILGRGPLKVHLEPIPEDQLPPINADTAPSLLSPGQIAQYRNALREMHSREPRFPQDDNYPRDWGWSQTGPQLHGGVPLHWVIGYTRIGGLLNNLVVADNKRFGQFVGIFITVIFAIISQGVSAAAGILDDSGVGDDGGLPGDPASGSGGSTSLDDMLSTIEDSITQDVSSAFDNLTGSIGDIVPDQADHGPDHGDTRELQTAAGRADQGPALGDYRAAQGARRHRQRAHLHRRDHDAHGVDAGRGQPRRDPQ